MMVRYEDSMTLPPLRMEEREVEFKKLRKNGKKSKIIYTCQNIITFDTESTSAIKINGQYISDLCSKDKEGNYIYSDADIEKAVKVGWVYIWMFCIDGVTIYGRTMLEFWHMMDKMQKTYIDPIYTANGNHTEYKARPIILVHNLSWDYYFIKKFVNFIDIFARSQNKPIKAIDRRGFEWRDTLALTNVKLALVPEIFGFEDKIEKKVGDLDYCKLRTPSTPLTLKEMGYCEADVQVLHQLGLKMVDQYNYTQDIPLTQTGRLRPEVYDVMHETGYDVIAQELQPRTADDFLEAMNLFQGGYTHSAYNNVGKRIENCKSYDITSSYPTVMLLEKYPIEKFRECNETLENLDLENYCYIIHLKINEMIASIYTSTFSFSKLLNRDDVTDLTLDNGRIRHCKNAEMILTEQDYLTLKESYDLIGVKYTIKRAKKDYLPDDFRKLILKYYKNKTQYKGDDLNAALYSTAKIFVNALYGLCVTQYITDETIYYNDRWGTVQLAPKEYIDDLKSKVETEEEELYVETMFKSIEDKIEQEMGNIKLPFFTGIWITAYSRRNLFKTMLAIDSDREDCGDIVYSDTDSVKFKGDHTQIFENYNMEILDRLEKMGNDLGVTEDDYAPKDKKGERHPIGVYDYEGEYWLKTWGAKKYISYDINKHELKMTVAGCSKAAINFIAGVEGNVNKVKCDEETALKAFEKFRIGLVIPREYSGRSVIYRVDDQGDNGIIEVYGEQIMAPSACVLIPCTYTLGLSNDYEDYIKTMCPHNNIGYYDRQSNLKEDIMEKIGLSEEDTNKILKCLKEGEKEYVINESL